MVGQRWKDFKTAIKSHVGERDSETVVASARQTFQSLFEWLGDHALINRDLLNDGALSEKWRTLMSA